MNSANKDIKEKLARALGHARINGLTKPEVSKSEAGHFVIKEGDWGWNKFKTKAKWLTVKNHFTYEQSVAMEDKALADILIAKDGYDSASGRSFEGYLATVISNALNKAAAQVADERSIWAGRRSLDAPLGEGEDSHTFGDLIGSSSGFNTNEKLWELPRSVRIRRKLRELKKNERARQRMLQQLVDTAEPIAADGDEANAAETNDPLTPEEIAERFGDKVGDDGPLSIASQHNAAVLEMGLSEDPDETPSESRFSSMTCGMGDAAAEIRENTLHLEVALVLAALEPRLHDWCELVLKGHDPVSAYKSVGFSKTSYYATVLPALRKAFANLRYAL